VKARPSLKTHTTLTDVSKYHHYYSSGLYDLLHRAGRVWGSGSAFWVWVMRAICEDKSRYVSSAYLGSKFPFFPRSEVHHGDLSVYSMR